MCKAALEGRASQGCLCVLSCGGSTDLCDLREVQMSQISTRDWIPGSPKPSGTSPYGCMWLRACRQQAHSPQRPGEAPLGLGGSTVLTGALVTFSDDTMELSSRIRPSTCLSLQPVPGEDQLRVGRKLHGDVHTEPGQL